MGLWNWLFGKPDSGSSTEKSTETDRRIRSGRPMANVKWRQNSFPLEAVGESNYQLALKEICGGHSRDGWELEVDARLEREPTNPYDPNAIAVTINGRTVGYVPRDQAKRLASQMAEDGIDQAACKGLIVGGWKTNQHDSGHFGVRLAVPKRGWVDFGLGKTAPIEQKGTQHTTDRPARPEPAETGPLVGQWVVVWGAPKYGEVAHQLASLGANSMADVGKSTTMVVAVDDEITEGMQRSATFRKIQKQIEQGSPVELVTMRELKDRLHLG